jgi:hypothetical protein
MRSMADTPGNRQKPLPLDVDGGTISQPVAGKPGNKGNGPPSFDRASMVSAAFSMVQLHNM